MQEAAASNKSIRKKTIISSFSFFSLFWGLFTQNDVNAKVTSLILRSHYLRVISKKIECSH